MAVPVGHVTKHSVMRHAKLLLSYSKVLLIYENISSVNSLAFYDILQSTCLGEVQTLKGKMCKQRWFSSNCFCLYASLQLNKQIKDFICDFQPFSFLNISRMRNDFEAQFFADFTNLIYFPFLQTTLALFLTNQQKSALSEAPALWLVRKNNIFEPPQEFFYLI